MSVNGYPDGKSIFQFKFNKDLPGTNRWTHLEQQMQNHMSSGAFFDHGTNMYTVDDDFFNMNDEINQNAIHQLVDFNNGNIDKIKIQSDILSKFENMDCYKTAFLIEYKNFIHGCILIYWDETTVNENVGNIVCKNVTLCGGGKFWSPIDCGKHDIGWSNDVSGKIAPKLESNILNKTKIATLYDPQLQHKVGISVSPLHLLWNGDNKHLYDLFGMAGSRSKFFCEYCLQSIEEMQADPTPTNRCTATRRALQIAQAAIKLASGDKYNQDLFKSIKNQPLLFAGPLSLGLPVVHIIQGPAARLWTIIAACIRFCKSHKNQIAKWNDLCHDIDNLNQEITQYKTTVDWMNVSDNQQCFDKEFVKQWSSKVAQLKQQISLKQQQLKHKQNELNDMEKQMTQNNGERDYLQLCDDLKIKPWHHKGDSMIGPSVKKYLYNWNIVLKTLKKYDPECARMMEPCLARLCFLAKCIWTKNKEKFNDECCYYLRFNVIEFDMLYHKIIRKYGGGVTGERFGVKWHMLYHCVEWIEGLRWSPAHMDDQRIENWNRHMEKYLAIFHCFGGEVNMEKMMNKIWRGFIV